MIVVAYDISKTSKRTKFSKFLERYGDRIQYSVFVCKNSKRIMENITTEIEHHFAKYFDAEDSVFVFTTCQSCDKKTLKYGNASHYEKDVIYFG
ncbi:CRISPR-associated endonuclease Cas2 [Candidatus Woesebacteria bacterium]|nr:CRISPR-associated endonuclease Cas2 [Candidatus Woesebacteria bacterium]MCB9801682.1 CRISPR-associated endonuclease Cas2 [Pseudomonadales bacterium]